MTPAFLAWIGLISLATLLPLLWPLLRKQSVAGTGSVPARALAVVLLIALPLAAVLLYRELGEPRALDPAQLVATPTDTETAPDLATAVAGLEKRLARDGDDIDGLRLLARGYQGLQRFADSLDALGRARALQPDDIDLQVEYAEAFALASTTRRIEGEAESLLTDALSRNPDHQRALWLSGIAAMQRDDRSAALAHWQHLLTLLPPDSTVYAAVAEQVREIGGEVPQSAAAEPATTNAAAIRIQVSVAAALRDQVAPGDTVYVFARAAEGPKMPLAIQRFAASELPREVVLDDSTGMTAGQRISRKPHASCSAPVSRSPATPSPNPATSKHSRPHSTRPHSPNPSPSKSPNGCAEQRKTHVRRVQMEGTEPMTAKIPRLARLKALSAHRPGLHWQVPN
jgi:cytochrome c-type biogenesis protein CcmH